MWPPPPPPPRAKASEAPRPPVRAAAIKTIIILRTIGILLLTGPSSKMVAELFMTGSFDCELLLIEYTAYRFAKTGAPLNDSMRFLYRSIAGIGEVVWRS